MTSMLDATASRGLTLPVDPTTSSVNDLTNRFGLVKVSSTSAQLMNTDKHSDVAFNDYGPEWEAMRKVVHSAIL